MPKYQHLALLIVLMSTSSVTHATDWWLLKIDIDQINFIDIESIKEYESGIMKTWIQSFDRDGKSSKALMLFNCKSEEFGLKALYAYNKDGNTASSNSFEYVDFKATPPETMASELLKISCSAEPSSQLNGQLQGPIKKDITPQEVATQLFKMTKKKQNSGKK
jgi:hypothetical protein